MPAAVFQLFFRLSFLEGHASVVNQNHFNIIRCTYPLVFTLTEQKVKCLIFKLVKLRL